MQRPPELKVLKYAVNNAANPSIVDRSRLAKQRGETRRMRTALVDGDPIIREEALDRLEEPQGRVTGRGKWHVLEGRTMVDAALYGEGVTVFVEGKRTESKLTPSTEWLVQREQIARNLDCLRDLPNRPVDGRSLPRRADEWFVLLAVEEGSKCEALAHQLDAEVEVLGLSLQHLIPSARAEATSRYVGHTTWQAIHRDFNLSTLPDTVRDL